MLLALYTCFSIHSGDLASTLLSLKAVHCVRPDLMIDSSFLFSMWPVPLFTYHTAQAFAGLIPACLSIKSWPPQYQL